MSITDIDQLFLGNAIADARRTIPLDACAQLTVDAVCESIRSLARERDDATSGRLASEARERRANWLHGCAQKDVENEKRRVTSLRGELEQMTDFRNDAVKRAEAAERARDEAKEALRIIVNCGNKKCCKQCKATAGLYAAKSGPPDLRSSTARSAE